MSIPASVLARMATLGFSPEQAEAVATMLSDVESATRDEAAEAIEARRANDRERKARQRHVKSREVTGRHVTSGDNPSPKEKSPTPPKEITPSPEPSGSDVSVKRARANDLADFRAECADLDAERLDAIVKHRRSKGGQLTGHAARLFRRDAEACGFTLAEAVDTCISRNWITVKPEYLRDRHRGSAPATAPPRDRTVSDVLGEIANGTWTGPQEPKREPDFPFIETSFSRRN